MSGGERSIPPDLTPPILAPRARRLEFLARDPFDVVVVGGGITGAGIALDLQLRGLRVLLVERGDWGSGTSSASSRLIHGGLRYLELGDYALVRESCLERGLLLRNAAGLVWPERFLFPLLRGDRVAPWKMAAGLALYAVLAIPRGLGLPRMASRAGVLRRLPGLDAGSLRGTGSYLDAATHDARLVLAVVLSAARAGALVLPRMQATALHAGSDSVEVEVSDVLAGASHRVRAARVVLAAGPGTDLLRSRLGLQGPPWIAPTRGSHVLIDRERLPIGCAAIFLGVDGRAMFLLPWPRHTVIGTTDVDADPAAPPQATLAEQEYLLASANRLLPGAELALRDVVATYAGLRPLLAARAEAPSARSREERVEREGPVYTIAGGKLTGYRAMAETLAARLVEELGRGARGRRSPTRDHRLVGALPRPVGPIDWTRAPSPDALLESALRRRYGSRAEDVRRACSGVPGGEGRLDPETLAGEIDWARRQEDAIRPEDFLLRRTDAGRDRDDRVRAVRARVEQRWLRADGEIDADRSGPAH